MAQFGLRECAGPAPSSERQSETALTTEFDMSQPLVSILIPCFNAEKYVGEAIDSALTQTYSNVEVVVIDDGSTDGSLEVIRSFGERIRWESGSNRGGCEARNRALALARGEFIQFLDADDILYPDKLACQLPELIEDRADFVFCVGDSFFPDGRRSFGKLYPSPTGYDPLIYCLSHTITTNAVLHRRTKLESVGGFREGLPRAQEWDLHVRLGAIGVRLSQSSRALFVIRRHPGPHVSQIRMPPQYFSDLLFDNVEAFERSGLLDAARRKSLAPILHLQAIYAYRNGAKETATRGFEIARRFASRYKYAERWWVRAIASTIGPLPTERFLELSRSLRNQVVGRPN